MQILVYQELFSQVCSGCLILSCLVPLLHSFADSQKLDADFTIRNCDNKYIDELMPQNKSYTRKVKWLQSCLVK